MVGEENKLEKSHGRCVVACVHVHPVYAMSMVLHTCTCMYMHVRIHIVVSVLARIHNCELQYLVVEEIRKVPHADHEMDIVTVLRFVCTILVKFIVWLLLYMHECGPHAN